MSRCAARAAAASSSAAPTSAAARSELPDVLSESPSGSFPAGSVLRLVVFLLGVADRVDRNWGRSPFLVH